MNTILKNPLTIFLMVVLFVLSVVGVVLAIKIIQTNRSIASKVQSTLVCPTPVCPVPICPTPICPVLTSNSIENYKYGKKKFIEKYADKRVVKHTDKSVKNIAFWDNQLCERGTALALYDYAYFNEKILGNKSYIFYDKNRSSVEQVIDKFKKIFTVHETDDFKEVDSYLIKYNISHIYIIKSGEKDTRISNVAKNVTINKTI